MDARKMKAIEVWVTPDRKWRWEVLKKYQKPSTEAKNPYSRWFCRVKSPYTDGDYGDVYVKSIKSKAIRIK